MSAIEWLVFVAVFILIVILGLLRSLTVLSNQLSLIRDQLDGVVDRHEENSLLNVAHDIRADVRTIAKATGADDDEDR